MTVESCLNKKEGTPGASNPRRVCVIGNSFIGAIYRAHENGFATDGFALSFFASPGPAFENVEFEKGLIVNTPVTSGGSPVLADYDVFVIYGDLPRPSDCLHFQRGTSGAHYSSQVLTTVIQAVVSKSKAVRLSQALLAMTRKPVFVVTRNFRQDSRIGDRTEYKTACTLVAAAIAPAIYIPQPPTVLSRNGRPKPIFYRNSLNGEGKPANYALHPDADVAHFNLAGGALILGHILEYLRKA